MVSMASVSRHAFTLRKKHNWELKSQPTIAMGTIRIRGIRNTAAYACHHSPSPPSEVHRYVSVAKLVGLVF